MWIWFVVAAIALILELLTGTFSCCWSRLLLLAPE